MDDELVKLFTEAGKLTAPENLALTGSFQAVEDKRRDDGAMKWLAIASASLIVLLASMVLFIFL